MGEHPFFIKVTFVNNQKGDFSIDLFF